MKDIYDDIIDMPHHVSAKRAPMPTIDRAVQFSPFAALTGFGAAIEETGRLTDEKFELDEYVKQELNDKLNTLDERIKERPVATICYFLPDERKSGGRYVTVTEAVEKIDAYRRTLFTENGKTISFDDIYEIQGPCFD